MFLSKQQIVARSKKFIFLILPVLLVQILNGFYLPKIAHTPWLFWTNDLLTFVVLPLIAYLGLSKLGLSPAQYGFKKPSILYDGISLLIHTLILFLFAWVVWRIAYYMLAHLFPTAPSFLYREIIPSNQACRWLVITYFSVAAGIVESALYLGVFKLLILARYTGHSSKIIFVATSTFVFALGHWEQGWAGLISAGLTQLIFCIAYLELKYLPPFILAHAVIDFILFL